jgi:hypothetical protein
VYSVGELHGPNDAVSSAHSNPADGSLEKVKLADRDVVVPLGPLASVVSGGVLSTTTERAAEDAAADEKSRARATTVAGPSVAVVESQRNVYGSASSDPATAPLTRNSTRSMPSGSDADAASTTSPWT